MERSLHIINDAQGTPTSGVCTSCNRRFIARPHPGEDLIHSLTREFDEHDCKENASKTGARAWS
jgi:hypothetical protein